MPNEHIVAQTPVDSPRYGHVIVSTVRLAVNRGYSANEPRWYETMVFPANGDTIDDVTDWTEIDIDRYATRDEAIVGHQAMIGRMASYANH